MLTFGELFAGISGFGLGFERAGMRCLWQVELDRDCNKVLEAHYPNVKRIRDVREAGKHNLESVDVIAFGWPCQDLSVAGLRAGLSGERSGLFHQAVRLIAELRPKWLVAENVPGLHSSFTPIDAPPGSVEIGSEWEVEEESDFAIVLAALDELGYCVAGRVLDAQYFNVPQRRERVFLIGSLGNTGSVQVLFNAEGLQGNPPTRREAGQRVAAPVKASAPNRRNGGSDPIADEFVIAATIKQRGRGACDEVMDNLQVSMPLKAKANSSHDESHETYVTHALRSEGADASEDGTGRGTPIIAAPLTANYGKQLDNSDRNGGPPNIVNCFNGYTGGPDDNDAQANHLIPTAYRTAGNCGPFEQGDKTAALNTATDPNQNIIAFSSKDHGADAGEIAPTLRSQNFDKSHINGGGQVAIAFDTYNQRDCGDKALSLSSGLGTAQHNAIAFTERGREGGANLETQDELSYALRDPQKGMNSRNAIAGGFGVRRLTPRECERLQGFPDDFTRYDANGKEISDSARYRMLGNAVAVPVARWIGKRIMSL